MKEDEKNIVIARLETMPESMKVSIGRFGSFGKWDLITHVRKEDEIGELVADIYMENLRSFKKEVQ